jgi:hypothetical protein
MKTLFDVLLFGAVILGIPLLIAFLGALFGGGAPTREDHEALDADHPANDWMESRYNPATGLLMVGGVDVEGNPYGTSNSDSTSHDD